MSASPQRFHRGDRVKVADVMPPWMRHFRAGGEAVIDHSHADQYGPSSNDRNYHIYAIRFLPEDHYAAWYDEELLTLIEKSPANLIDEMNARKRVKP